MKVLVKIFAFIVVLFLVLLVIGIIEKNSYPKSEADALNLFTGKFWKLSEVELQDIYVDGVLVKEKHGGWLDITGTLNEQENKKTKSKLETIERSFKNNITKDNFYTVQKLSNGALLSYEESFDDEINANSFSYNFAKVAFENDKYVLKYEDGVNKYFDSRVAYDSGFSETISELKFKNSSVIIESISSKDLEIISCGTLITENGEEYKIKLKKQYLISQPKSLVRFKEVFDFWK